MAIKKCLDGISALFNTVGGLKEWKAVNFSNLTLCLNRVQEDLWVLEDRQLALVQNIPHRHDHIPGKKPVPLYVYVRTQCSFRTLDIVS